MKLVPTEPVTQVVAPGKSILEQVMEMPHYSIVLKISQNGASILDSLIRTGGNSWLTNRGGGDTARYMRSDQVANWLNPNNSYHLITKEDLS